MSSDVRVDRGAGDRTGGCRRDRAWPARDAVAQRVAHIDIGAGAGCVQAVGRVLCGARVGDGGCHGRSVVGVGHRQDVGISDRGRSAVIVRGCDHYRVRTHIRVERSTGHDAGRAHGERGGHPSRAETQHVA